MSDLPAPSTSPETRDSQSWFKPRRDWTGPRALLPLATCYRLFELFGWTFAVTAVFGIGVLTAQPGGSITESPLYWVTVGSVGAQLLALVSQNLPFPVRYAVFFTAGTILALSNAATVGLTPAWALLMVILLSSAGLLFGVRTGSILSATFFLLHVGIAWGWVSGRLPLEARPDAYRIYTDLTVSGVWVRLLGASVALWLAIQWVMGYVLADLHRGLSQATAAVAQLRAEKLQRERTQERFASVFNFSPDICGLTRVSDSVILDVNRTFENQTGWSREEAIGRSALDLGFWSNATERDSAVRVVLEKGELSAHEITWRTRAGAHRSGLLSMRLMELDGEKVFNVVVRDITERRRRDKIIQAFSDSTGAETGRAFFAASLRLLATELSVRFALIVETVSGDDGVASGRTLAAWADGPVPDFTYALPGTPCENVLSQGLCHYPDRVAELFPADKLLSQMGARSYAGLPIRDTQGRTLGLVVVLDDKPMPDAGTASVLLVLVATRAAAEMQRLQSEQQVAQLNSALESRVRERTAELAARVGEVERLNEELRTLMRDLRLSQAHADRSAARLQETNASLLTVNQELEAFSYSVSHDLRAPLRNLTGFLELLSKRTEGRVDAESERYIGVLRNEASRMGLLIDDLLTFSRIGRTEMRLQPVQLDELVTMARATLESDIRDRVIEWSISPLPTVRGDPTLLGQVIMNLLSNAVKFSRRAPVARIEVGSSPPVRGDQWVTIHVRDNGVGFNPKYLDRLFGVFQRLHSQRDFEGTGIGLANTKRVVNRHGGRIWAEGQIDQGASFFFTLPIHSES